MKSVILNSFLCELGVSLSKKLIINSDTVVGKGLSMTVVDAFANIEKFEIIVNCFFVFFDVIVENSNGVVGSTLISDFSCSSAPKGKHFVVF